jgi:SAM-dependent methyltransferase
MELDIDMKRPNCTQLSLDIQTLVGHYCQGNGVDVGCGYSKIGACVGIDKIPWGCLIHKDDETHKISQADWSFDILNLPIKDNSMDFVYASHVLEHITLNETTAKTKEAIEEWLRILKPGGYLLMLIPHIKYCIPPVAKRKGIVVYHGLDPDEVKTMIDSILWVEVVKFQSLSTKDVFDCVLRKV